MLRSYAVDSRALRQRIQECTGHDHGLHMSKSSVIHTRPSSRLVGSCRKIKTYFPLLILLAAHVASFEEKMLQKT